MYATSSHDPCTRSYAVTGSEITVLLLLLFGFFFFFRLSTRTFRNISRKNTKKIALEPLLVTRYANVVIGGEKKTNISQSVIARRGVVAIVRTCVSSTAVCWLVDLGWRHRAPRTKFSAKHFPFRSRRNRLNDPSTIFVCLWRFLCLCVWEIIYVHLFANTSKLSDQINGNHCLSTNRRLDIRLVSTSLFR